MKHFSNRIASGFAAAAALSAFGCSSESGDPADTGGEVTEACTNPTGLDIFFSPMYSAFDGVHDFKIPAIVNGVSGASITWSASDPSKVLLERDTNTGGVLITTRAAGTVNIQASVPDGRCGSAPLTITQSSAADWEIGNARYNNGQPLPPIPNPPAIPADGSNLLEAGGARPACVNCHGVTGANQIFQSVSHTPQQTGGFSDDELRAIFTSGVIPPGGYYDASVIPQQIWSFFHKWTVSEEEARGLVVYLRALTPKSQGAKVDFSGVFGGGAAGAPATP